MRMRTTCSGSDGMNSYDVGINNIWPEHAKKVFMHNHGCPVDANDDDLTFDHAVAALKLNDDQLALALANRETI